MRIAMGFPSFGENYHLKKDLVFTVQASRLGAEALGVVGGSSLMFASFSTESETTRCQTIRVRDTQRRKTTCSPTYLQFSRSAQKNA